MDCFFEKKNTIYLNHSSYLSIGLCIVFLCVCHYCHCAFEDVSG